MAKTQKKDTAETEAEKAPAVVPPSDEPDGSDPAPSQIDGDAGSDADGLEDTADADGADIAVFEAPDADSEPSEADKLAKTVSTGMRNVERMFDGISEMHTEVEALARKLTQTGDHVGHAKFALLAQTMAEFRNGLKNILSQN